LNFSKTIALWLAAVKRYIFKKVLIPLPHRFSAQ